MKKNITINLCGRLFPIDEDAYEMLSTYEQSLRNYFRSREGGEEIVDDIEARIAELLDELKEQGTEAVTIENITEIIQRIGKPEEMDSLSPDPSPEDGKERKKQEANNSEAFAFGGAGIGAKRLYRDPYDKKLMGVLSGFAAYFGIDVLWCRLGYVAAILFSFVGSTLNFLWWLPGHHFFFNIQFWVFALIIDFVVLSILMPVAWSPEDRLRMKGKPINPQNLAEEVTKSSGASAPYTEEENPKMDGGAATIPPSYKRNLDKSSSASGCLGCIGGFFTTLWAVITLLFRGCIYTFGVFVTIMCIVGIICLAAFGLNTEDIVSMMDIPQPEEFTAILLSMKVPFYIFFVSAITVLSITAYAIIHSLLNEFKQMPAMPYRQRIILLIIWIVGVIMAGSAIVYGVPKFVKEIKKIERTESRATYSRWDCYNETPDTVCVEKEVITDTVCNEKPQVDNRINSRRVVRVRPGDTIGTIAKRNHTTVRELRRINRLHDERLRPGQVLRVK